MLDRDSAIVQGLPRPRPSGRDGLTERPAPVHLPAKFVVVVDRSINIRDPCQGDLAISARWIPQRDLFGLETPVRFLDFASEALGLAQARRSTSPTFQESVPEKRHAWGEPLSRPAGAGGHLDGALGPNWPGDRLACDPDPVLFGLHA